MKPTDPITPDALLNDADELYAAHWWTVSARLRAAAARIEALERENGVLTVDRDTYRDMTHELTDRIEALGFAGWRIVKMEQAFPNGKPPISDYYTVIEEHPSASSP